MSNREDEVRAAYEAYIATRERIMAGELPWSALSAHFTEDAVFIDPAWGRVEGLDAMITFFDDSMQGLDGWEFPEEWTIVDGDRVVSAWWNRLPGRTPDGGYPQALGISTLLYGGDGKFYYEHDLLNMAEVMEAVNQSTWSPSGPMHVPPAVPNRDISVPER